MNQERLFELIRNEDVVLWVGAGFSRYAGFPMGERLKEIILESLTKSELDEISPNLSLIDLTEEYVRLKSSKNPLLRILQNKFINFIPSSTIYHDKLAAISHIKTVITTNYDKLLENAYGLKGQVLISSKQVSYLEKDKVEIFKAHGDLSDPDSIIITKSDYNNFFKDNSENSLYWTVIKERLATKSILFLGYNLEDPNVSIIFDKITETLSSNRKECFLVAPNLPQHKVKDLIRKNINYINSTGEELINNLIINIDDNIFEDLNNSKIQPNTLNNYILNKNLKPTIEFDDKSYKLQSLKSIKNNIQGDLNLSLKPDDEFFIEEFNNFIHDKKIGIFAIPKEKILKSEFRLEGLKIPNSDAIDTIIFETIPIKSATIEVSFENGQEFSDIEARLYGNANNFQVHLKFKAALLKFIGDLNNVPSINFKFEFTHNDICTKLSDEIVLFSFLKNISSNQKFTVFFPTGEKITQSLVQLEQISKHADSLLDYFEKLRIIEKHYNIRFVNFEYESITKTSFDLVSKVILIIKGQCSIVQSSEEATLNISSITEDLIDFFLKNNDLREPLICIELKEEIVEIHGQKINLGCKKVEFVEPFVTNIDSLKEKKVKEVKFKSKKILISYTKNEEK